MSDDCIVAGNRTVAGVDIAGSGAIELAST